jgi:hypothetical protein
MTDLQKQLNDFLNWLKLNHPEILEKYEGNFQISFTGDGGICVNQNNKISIDEYNMLLKIASDYYHP